MTNFDRARPHNDLPALPPALELETKAVLKQLVGTTRALAELKGAGDLIPNQSVLVRLIGLQEAKLSSEIENIVTTNDELYRAYSDTLGKYDPATKEVLHYNDALWFGFQHLRDGNLLTTNLFEQIASIIKETEMRVRTGLGTKIENAATKQVVYTPPEGDRVIRDMLRDLERFMYDFQDGLDPLVKLALLHYQFEAIHPFLDGNGRTGRILNILYLVDQKLLEWPVLYLSRYVMEHRAEYYEGLRRVTEQGDWESWVLYMLRAVESTALETRLGVVRIRDVMDATAARLREVLPGVYSKDLLEVLFSLPYCRIPFVQSSLGVSRPTASTYLRQLEDHGFVRGLKVGREMYFINDLLLKVLAPQ
jgi:Fic family protein